MTSLRRTERGMANVRLSKLEFVILETLWTRGRVSIREMLEDFPAKKRPTYSTVQTMVYRLEAKGVVQAHPHVGNFHMFEAAITREAAQGWIDELLAILGGKSRPAGGAADRGGQADDGGCGVCGRGAGEGKEEAGERGSEGLVVSSQ